MCAARLLIFLLERQDGTDTRVDLLLARSNIEHVSKLVNLIFTSSAGGKDFFYKVFLTSRMVRVRVRQGRGHRYEYGQQPNDVSVNHL